MSNPAIIECAAGAWEIVATDVTKGQLHIQSKDFDRVENPPLVYWTYRLNGGAVPTGLTEAVEVPAFDMEIGFYESVDIYVYPVGVAVNVRIDL